MLTLAKMTDKKWKEIAPRLPRTYAPDDVKARFAKFGDPSVYRAGDGWVAILDAKDGTGTCMVLGAGEETPRATDVPRAKALRIHHVSADGKRACVAASEDVLELDLASGKSRVVFRLPEGAWARSMVYLAGDRAAIVHGATLLLLATGDEWREVSSMKLEGENELTAIRGGAILLLTPAGWYGARTPVAYAVKGDALEEIGRAQAHFRSGADELDGRVFVTDSKWKRHELLGLPGTPKTAGPETTADDYTFYGESPSDWYEGANLGHVYEIVFREQPSAPVKAKIAKLFSKETRKGPIEASPTPWMWSGRWALFFVGERTAHGERFFEAVRALLDKVHAIEPLAEVIFRGTRADDTTYPRPPTPGPRYPDLALPAAFGSKHDDTLPIAAPDPAFEKARAGSR